MEEEMTITSQSILKLLHAYPIEWSYHMGHLNVHTIEGFQLYSMEFYETFSPQLKVGAYKTLRAELRAYYG